MDAKSHQFAFRPEVARAAAGRADVDADLEPEPGPPDPGPPDPGTPYPVPDPGTPYPVPDPGTPYPVPGTGRR
jgi:hypothetical protein